MKKTNLKCMYLVDDLLYNKVLKDNQTPKTLQYSFKKNYENIPSTFTSNKPNLDIVSNTSDIVSTPSLGLNSENETSGLPSLPASPIPSNSLTHPMHLTSQTSSSTIIAIC